MKQMLMPTSDSESTDVESKLGKDLIKKQQ